jgi:hypothetical protein
MIFLMWWGRVLMGGLFVVMGCATKPAAAQAPANTPPPRGAPQPRAVDQPMPPPGRVSETNDVYQERFPILEGQQRKEQAKRAKAAQAATRVEVVRSKDTVNACDGLTAEEKTECPLHDPGAVLSISDLPNGARVSLRAGNVPPERLQQMFACHKTLAAARPKAPTACTFFDARTEAEVVGRDNRIEIDLERKGDADLLREQVLTALRKR